MPGVRGAAASRDRESGAAVVDFVLVSVLVLVIALAVLQLGVALHVRNTLTWAASEGARVGARRGALPEEGAERARSLIGESLNPAYAGDIRAIRRVDDGVRVVEVQVSAPLPVIGLWGPGGSVTARGRAFDEAQE